MATVTQRFVDFSAHPQTMQQDRQLTRRSNDRSFLPVLSTTLGHLRRRSRQLQMLSLSLSESLVKIDGKWPVK